MKHLDPGGRYCAYLRKSRRDLELEALGQGETLARHERQLNELAQRLGIRISRTYREIVSGDTLSERPQAQQLLEDVNAGMWDGVLAMDVDRFGRGDSIDQGVIMQSFFYSGTLIVTPDKIYDPADDSDAEFFEVKLFFARREYAMIKKRMQRGRILSVMDGCYLGPDLYGYRRVKLKGRKGWSLEIVPDQAEIVRAMFGWYAYGMDGHPVGAETIARRLNDMGVATARGNRWTASTVKCLLQNPTYAGKIRWNTRKQQIRIVDGRRVKSRPKCDDPILVDGLHAPIVDADLWQRVSDQFATHSRQPKSATRHLVNPFAGLLVCGECGHMMQIKGDPNRRGDFIGCVTQDCPTYSAYVFVLEDMVLEFLAGWIADAEAELTGAPVPDPDAQARAAARAQLAERLDTLQQQSGRLYDLLEQGVYTIAVYRQRRASLDAQIAEAIAQLDALDAEAPRRPSLVPLLPQLRTVVDTYRAAPDAAEKNRLLRTVIDRIIYTKPRRLYRNNNLGDYITLTIYPKYPAFFDE